MVLFVFFFYLTNFVILEKLSIMDLALLGGKGLRHHLFMAYRRNKFVVGPSLH